MVGRARDDVEVAARARLEEQRQGLTNELVALQSRAGSLGLYRTMQAIKEACRVVGWERALLNAGGAEDEGE